MIRFLRLLPIYFASLWHWHKARGHAERGEYKEALKRLDRMRDIGVEPISALVLRAETLNHSGQLRDCYHLCVKLMQEIPSRHSIPVNLQKYITTYLLCIARHAKTKGAFDRTTEVPHLKKTMLEEIDLDAIPKYWLINFPLRAHPSWNRLTEVT